jgi:MFS family permease
MGIYYTAPLLGPALGPIFGGVLTTGFNWRAPFWFLAIVAGLTFLSFLLFFEDTFRRERSRTYQSVLKRQMRDQASAQSSIKDTITDIEAARSDPQALKQNIDTEKQDCTSHLPAVPGGDPSAIQPTLPVAQLSLNAVNPFKPLWLVLCRWNNFISLVTSGSSLLILHGARSTLT